MTLVHSKRPLKDRVVREAAPSKAPGTRAVSGAERAARELIAQGAAVLPIIPSPIDQNPCAQSRRPRDMTRQGWSTSLFQASQQWSTRLS